MYPDEREYLLAQAPIQRPPPIERPAPIERPVEQRPNRFRSAPQQQPQPRQNRFRDGPAAAPPAGQPVAPQEPAASAEETGRFQFMPPGAPEMSIQAPTQEAIEDALRRATPEQRKKILQEWAASRVAKEREAGGAGQWIDDRVRTIARGTPVGSWLDEANASIDSGLHRVTGGAVGMPYDQRLEYERAKDRARDKDASVLFRVPGVGNFDTADAEKLTGGLLSLRAAPVVPIMRGSTMIPRVVNSMATGGLYGGVYGAGEGEDTESRLAKGGTGMAIGTAIGAAVPPVQSAVGNIYGALSRYFNRPQGAIAGMDRGAVDKISSTGFSDPAARSTYQRIAGELGPEGMLADMGNNLRMDAARIARNPGDGGSAVINALRDRKRGATARIAGDVDEALGRTFSVPEVMDRLMTAGNRRAKPYYDEFYATPIPHTDTLVRTVQRVPQSAWAKARELAEAEGVDLASVMNTGRGLDYIKRGIDDIAQSAPRRSNEARVYGGLARDLRNEVDRILSPADPAQSPWAIARRITGADRSFNEALESGQSAFSKGRSPDQMAFDLRRMTPGQRIAYRHGARDEVRQVMGESATAWGANGDTAARRLLGSDNARAKLDLIAKPGGAERLTRRLDAETEFQRTLDEATGNSITGTMQAAAKRWPAPDGGDAARSDLAKSSLQGVAMAAAHRIVNAIRGGALNERLLREQQDAARMLIAQGADRDAIAAALIQYAQRTNLSRGRRQAIEAIVNDVMSAPRPLAVD